MPPPQHFLSNRLRGYVCKSCLSKLQAPRRQQAPWALRTFATNEKHKKDKGVWDLPYGIVRYFEQTPDGVRTEIKDEEDEAFTASLRKHLKILQERTGKTVDDLEEEDLQQLLVTTMADVQGEKGLEGPFRPPSMSPQTAVGVGKAPDEMAAQNNDIQSQMDFINSFDLDNLSEQDSLRLREGLLDFVKKDKLPAAATNQTPQLGPNGSNSPLGSRVLALPIASFPLKDQRNIRTLHECVTDDTIEQAQRPTRRRGIKKYGLNTDAKINKTWRAYIMCRGALKSAPHLVSSSFWTALWNILSKDDIHNLDRMSHLQLLGGDMVNCGFDMDPAQKLLYIEATFIEGNQVNAIKTWETMGQGCSDMANRMEYWDLGSRMFCRHGLVDRAINCADKIFQNTNSPKDFRLLLPIIGAILKSGDTSYLQRAWALYIRLRFNLGANFIMEDYDSLITMFMNANHAEQALSIFKDMMLTNEPEVDRDSIGRYTDSVGKHAILSSLKIHTSELDWQDFKTVDILPPRFNNRIFFGSWLKKLIGDGDLESAEKVHLIMQERGIRPTSISINGLIGAWLRKGNETYRLKADALAWQMIKERQEIVALRKQQNQPRELEGPIRMITTDSKLAFKPVVCIPYATIETFAILLQQYTLRQKFQDAASLFAALESAKLKPNTNFMNQMLLTHIKAKSMDLAIKTYGSLTGHQLPEGAIVRPDLDTYQILWENLARFYDPIRRSARTLGVLGSPRGMFRDMVRHLKNHGGPLPNELYQTIVLCFCLLKDQVGTAVALKGMQKYFGNYPTDVTARAIVLQIARTGLKSPDGVGTPRRLDLGSKVTRQRIESVTQALTILKERRAEELRKNGVELDELEGNAKLEETLVILSRLLKYSYEHKPLDGPGRRVSASEARQKAVDQMGVLKCLEWDGKVA